MFIAVHECIIMHYEVIYLCIMMTALSATKVFFLFPLSVITCLQSLNGGKIKNVQMLFSGASCAESWNYSVHRYVMTGQAFAQCENYSTCQGVRSTTWPGEFEAFGMFERNVENMRPLRTTLSYMQESYQ